MPPRLSLSAFMGLLAFTALKLGLRHSLPGSDSLDSRVQDTASTRRNIIPVRQKPSDRWIVTPRTVTLSNHFADQVIMVFWSENIEEY